MIKQRPKVTARKISVEFCLCIASSWCMAVQDVAAEREAVEANASVGTLYLSAVGGIVSTAAADVACRDANGLGELSEIKTRHRARVLVLTMLRCVNES